jgi:hypothetical protein
LGGCVGRRRQEAREEQQEQQDAAALARENVRLRRNQLEMEKFLADYGLVWVGDQPQASVRHKIGCHPRGLLILLIGSARHVCARTPRPPCHVLTVWRLQGYEGQGRADAAANLVPLEGGDLLDGQPIAAAAAAAAAPKVRPPPGNAGAGGDNGAGKIYENVGKSQPVLYDIF